MTADTLSITGLSLAHGATPLVQDLDLDITRGRVTALLGASGSGKSLTCAGVLGVLPPGVRCVAGRVTLGGQDMPPEVLRGRVVASVLQNPRTAFNPVMTMAAHAAETLRAQGRIVDRARMAEALAAVGLDDPDRVLALHPFEMSGGMLQRAMIALALLSEAPFLFADEPTTDLDVLVQAQVLDLLADVVARHRLGLLLVTHDLGVVARLADDVVVLAAGRVVERAPASRLFAAPRHPVSRGLIAAHLALYEETP